MSSLIYTFLPYHLWHGESHLLRSTYVSAPLAALLLVWLGSWRARFLVDALGPYARALNFTRSQARATALRDLSIAPPRGRSS